MKLKKFLQLKSEGGSATIEAVISFTGFMFVIFTILNVVNVCRAQMLISNAVDTATKELTQYSYFYEMSGLSKFKADVDGQADIGANNLNDVIGTVDAFASSVGNAYDKSSQHKTNIENAVTNNFDVDAIQKEILSAGTDVEVINGSIKSMEASFGSVADNPLMYMKSIVAVAGSQFIDTGVSHLIAAPLSKALFTKHFGKNAAEANKELEKLGVVGGLEGMNFKMSTLFAKGSEKDVHIVVYYKLKLVQVLDWASLEVSMCKESVGHAWLGGDSVKKTVTPMEKPAVEDSTDGDSTENQDPAQNPEGEQPEGENPDGENPGSEGNEGGNEENTENENSSGSTGIWAKPTTGDDGYTMVRNNAFYDYMGDKYGFEPDKNSAFLLGHNGSTAYACTDIVDSEWFLFGMGENEHSVIMENAYYEASRALKEAEKLYDPTVGDSMGQLFTYKPGEVKDLIYVVYVPENMPEDVLNDLKSKCYIGQEKYKQMGKDKLGRELDVHISFERAGGNYDYGSESQMINLVFTLVSIAIIIVSQCFMYLYMTCRLKESKKVKDFFTLVFNKKYVIVNCVSLVFSILVFLYSFFLIKDSFLKSLMNAEVLLWLTAIGCIDLEEKIIPNKLIIAGISFWVILSVVEILLAKTMWQQLLMFSVIGAGICGGVLFLIAIIVKSALGMGDVKMFFVIGLLYGLSGTYSILLLSIMIMALVSIILLIAKKVTTKTAIPMAPFVALGFLLCVLMGI